MALGKSEPTEARAPGSGREQPSARARWREALASAEGKILLAGLALAVLYLTAMCLTLCWSADLFHKVLGITTTHLIGGRAAGLSVGYSYGMPRWFVIVVNMVIETITVLVAYPLFVLYSRHLIVIGPLNDALERAQQAAQAQQKRILRYGIPMLFLFVWFPMYFTGPVVGAIIGYLIGLRPLVNLAIVLAGTYVAVFCWGMALQKLTTALEALGPYPPVIFVAAVMLVAVSLLVRRAIADHNHKQGPPGSTVV